MHDDDFIIGSNGDGPFFFAVDDCIGEDVQLVLLKLLSPITDLV